MDYVFLAVIASAIGSISLILVYAYLYALYRERYMGLWAISWLLVFSRYAIFDSGILSWKESILGLFAHQIISISSVLLFAWATHIFINKPLTQQWLYKAIGFSIILTILNVLYSPLSYKLLFPIYICSFVGVWIGLTFIRNFKLHGVGNLIIGYSCILLSLLTLCLPFLIHNFWLSPWGYSISGVLRLSIAIGTLITYFEKARVDLIDKELQYRLVIDNTIDVIYHYQLLPEATMKYISPSVFALTGYTPEDYYADSHLILNLVHYEDLASLKDFIDALPHSTASPLTLRLLTKDKTFLWVEQHFIPIYDEEDHLIEVKGIIHDITIRKNLEQMTSSFDRMNIVGNMAATVAHEIRNPITTVRGYLQFLGKKEKYQTDKEKFTLMIEEIDRANAIIREYLSFSRRKETNVKPCSLNHIIEALFPLLQANAHSSKVHVIVKLTAIPDLLLNENEIRQLLLNLVRNSIEAMPSGGNLVIRTFLENQKIVLSVSDQGPGIPSYIMDHLGTPFLTTKDTGTGLGLSICYQIADRHNAIININTSHNGTTFFVYFNPIST